MDTRNFVEEMNMEGKTARRRGTGSSRQLEGKPFPLVDKVEAAASGKLGETSKPVRLVPIITSLRARR